MSSKPTISLSVDFEGRRIDELDIFKYVSVLPDVLYEGPTLPGIAKNIAKQVIALSGRVHNHLEDMRFKVTRFNPNLGDSLYSPLRATVILDDKTALDAVSNVVTVLVNEELRKLNAK